MREVDRRTFLQRAAATASGVSLYPACSLAAALHQGHPLAPRPGHHPAKAKHLILFFMTGGMSHIDTFDHKPKLNADAGKKLGDERTLKASQFAFSRYGSSGRMVSELLPHMGGKIDELCLLHSVFNPSAGHSAATLGMHTGSITFPLPSIGSWISHGLGTLNPSLPSFIVFAEKEPYNAYQCWDAHFLPAYHTGTRVIPGPQPIAHLKNPITSLTRRELERTMLRDLNEAHLDLRAGDLDLEARASSFNTAYGLMQEAPEAFDISHESDGTLAAYGLDRNDRKSFAWQCLSTRRLIERGVRVVELFDVGSNSNWDDHGNMELHRKHAKNIDQPIAALIGDLRERGMLEDTLIVGCTEFGRTPWADKNPKGRGHHAAAFTCFFAGGGSKAGYSHGETDAYGAEVVSNPVHLNDFHATILHLMGLDHESLTYRYSGRDYRLTDVGGEVVDQVIA
ncbi:MAG: hypothetical protein ACI9QL_002928 [Candidatus Omnitrophota bacterium]|jgi:hypothetical protein